MIKAAAGEGSHGKFTQMCVWVFLPLRGQPEILKLPRSLVRAATGWMGGTSPEGLGGVCAFSLILGERGGAADFAAAGALDSLGLVAAALDSLGLAAAVLLEEGVLAFLAGRRGGGMVLLLDAVGLSGFGFVGDRCGVARRGLRGRSGTLRRSRTRLA